MHRRFFPIAVVLLVLAAACPAEAFPNDLSYGYQWYAPVIGLPTAWGVGLGSSGVIVAVLDTGVMANTPDLAGRLLPAISATGLPPLDGTDNHHGTWVASVAGMGVNNGLGGAGVGNFTILPVTVSDADGFNSYANIATGIEMAADAGARVINISLATLKYGPLDDAAAYARSKGALVFVAAGNSGTRKEMPAEYANLIFVSGTDRDDDLWAGSTYGPFVDLSAPAVDILIADPTWSGGMGRGTGTSFAAPLVAGAAALAWSINPHLTPDEVYAILKESAVDLGTPGWDEVFGWGRIDIGAVAERANRTAGAPEPATLGLLAAGLVLWGAGRRATRPR